ncbi:hypothetical protein OS493_038304 [Desmophyllum pertusum]|uniref:Helitron helicase-like domain-containing protein n=1 Tax=Desmophyllum pertusum TaxID=174260 RepID=A0A9W9Z6P6_9CNID|nr:hypothetical protein OS493_038304 [Desmophyllum pertusum]
MCETIIEGATSRESAKVAFMTKLLSNVFDYQLHFELLQFQYDRWIFKTITGAVNTGRVTGCSPAIALQHKTFSIGYWQWQHCLLIDAVQQYGFPSFFVTISPYEWSFPFPPWLESLCEKTGRGPTNLAVLKTIHIAHCLEQIVRGYLCGSNTNRWKHNVFNDSSEGVDRNVQTYFYRFEFQQRGTVHLHLLVWLRDVTKVRHSLLQATIPWDVTNDAFTVASIQKSDRSVLPVDQGANRFQQSESGTHLQFHYTEDDAERNIRAYITTLLGLSTAGLLLWIDCPVVPVGTAYVGMTRVRKFEDVKFITRVLSQQVKPACSEL